MLCVDLTSISSLENAMGWFDKYFQMVSAVRPDPYNIPVAVVGTKSDATAIRVCSRCILFCFVFFSRFCYHTTPFICIVEMTIAVHFQRRS